jgi:hypothetical protein
MTSSIGRPPCVTGNCGKACDYWPCVNANPVDTRGMYDEYGCPRVEYLPPRFIAARMGATGRTA